MAKQLGVRQFDVTINGITPLLMHWDNIAWADEMDRWKTQPKKDSNEVSKAGDDRTPAWRWIGCLYHVGAEVVMPADNLMRCLMEGGATVPVPGGRNGKTFKAQTQSGIACNEQGWPLMVNGKGIPFTPFEAVVTKRGVSFAEHEALAQKHGFELFVKRVKVGASKHIRVRPMFSKWSASGSLTVVDDTITEDILESILTQAGTFKGLGDWRPSGRTPGPFGKFVAEVRQR